jgi:dTDP-4-dehydrorhamnose reductase
MNNILVTGSKGQLGNEIQVLVSKYPELTFFFHDIDTLDITNKSALNAIFEKIKPSFIINCAAYTAVDKAETETDKAFLINDLAVKNIAEVAVSQSCKIIHVSTDYVFDGKKNIPYIETDKTNPMSAYGKSKLAGEQHLINLKDAIIIRTAWLYSSFGNNFVKTMIRLGKERSEIKVVCDQIGNPTYAADLAKAILDIIKYSIQNSFKPGIYHFANEGACSWYDLACETIFQYNLPSKVQPIESKDYPTPTTRPEYSVFNKSKIKQTFGIKIPWWKHSLTECIKKLRE